MIKHIAKLATIICSLALASLPVSTMAADVLRKKPRHVWGGPSSVVNNQSITKMIWAPGIDDGYVPQGITVAEGFVLVSSYKSTDPKVTEGLAVFSRLTPKRANPPAVLICQRIADMSVALSTSERVYSLLPIRGGSTRWT